MRIAVDATGFEARHVSHWYGGRTGSNYDPYRRRWPKLTAVVDVASHFIVGAAVHQGPSADTLALPEAVAQAIERVSID